MFVHGLKSILILITGIPKKNSLLVYLKGWIIPENYNQERSKSILKVKKLYPMGLDPGIRKQTKK